MKNRSIYIVKSILKVYFMEEISFIKRISKLKKDKLIVIIPKDRLDDFGHKDLVKVILLKKRGKRK